MKHTNSRVLKALIKFNNYWNAQQTHCLNASWRIGGKGSLNSGIDLFSLYILFSHFRPRDATRGNSFFQMSSYARANLRITNEKNKEENSHEGITWSEMGKQNVQAEKVY